MDNPEYDPGQTGASLDQLQKLLNEAAARAAAEIEVRQKLHSHLVDASSLVKSFSVERKSAREDEYTTAIQSQFSQTAATTFVPLAMQLQNQEDPRAAKATAWSLLSSLQTSLSSSLVELPDPDTFKTTKGILVSSSYPIQGAIETLRPLLAGFPAQHTLRLDSVAADLLNSTNPLSLANAATNARELLTFLARDLQSDEALKKWVDLELDKGNPTRRTRLEYYLYLGLPKAVFPNQWVETLEIQVSALLKSFKALSKLTHLNEKTTSALITAKLTIGEFIEHLVTCLNARQQTRTLIVDALMEPVSDRLQELADVDLQGQLEEGVSHAFAPTVWVDDLELTDIEGLEAYFSGSGSITCTFQIGSNSDVRRDDGAEWEGSRNLSFTGEATLDPSKRLKGFEEIRIEADDCELEDLDYDELEDDSEE